MPPQPLSEHPHLKQLESESIHILRETVSEFQNPALLYSVGKDSSVLLHLARKAFFPGKIPFPLLHIDTGFKFPEMYTFRDQTAKKLGVNLLVYRNETAIQEGVNPHRLGTKKCCAQLKTKALLDALTTYKVDAAIGGARRDEEKSRAKERIYSLRDTFGQWDPKNQRPELWNLYNGQINPGESVRIFPLSNWTELDIWTYIRQEAIDVVPLYFASPRSVIAKDGQLLPPDPTDLSSPLQQKTGPTETIFCRFRSLGCMPCSGAIQSSASSLDEIIDEMKTARTSERVTRVIDHDQASSMELKKREGYF